MLRKVFSARDGVWRENRVDVINRIGPTSLCIFILSPLATLLIHFQLVDRRDPQIAARFNSYDHYSEGCVPSNAMRADGGAMIGTEMHAVIHILIMPRRIVDRRVSEKKCIQFTGNLTG